MVLNTQMKNLLIGSFSWLRILRSLLLIYIVIALWVYFMADGMIFIPQPSSYRDTDEIVKIPVTENQMISAIRFDAPGDSPTLVFMHGNAEDLGDIRPYLEELHSWNFSVFSYDYRGYGTSDGKASVRNAHADADAVYQYLTGTLKIPSGRIILYGRSVGSGSAVYLASKYPVGGLILESAFTSAFRVVLPFPVFPFDRFPNRKRLRSVSCPVLVMHGRMDKVIPFQHGRILYDTAPEPKMALWLDTAGHNDLAYAAGEKLRETLNRFSDLVTAAQ
jgi:abhydrolase domain-containing protein 17